MFRSSGAHPFLLSPRDYAAEDTFAAEQAGVFRRSWNVVAAARDLQRPGDQLATEVGGLPVLVRNEGGELRAFLNVCAHRHSLLAPPGRSHQATFRCQYHGWQYGADGRLAHLPDGPSFKGWKASDARLQAMRCRVAYGLVFVNPGPGDGTLEDDHGPVSAELARHFDGMELRWIQESVHDANWKIIVENAVESYHVPLVHAATFGRYQDEEKIRHVVEPTFTQYHDEQSLQDMPRLARMIDEVFFAGTRLWGYSHTHVFPNHLVTWGGFYREWVVVEPLGPRRSRRLGYGFFPKEVRHRGPLGLAERLALDEHARRTRKGADRILAEDSSVWTSVQRGSEASPHRGVIGAREERVAAFHRWLLDRRAA